MIDLRMTAAAALAAAFAVSNQAADRTILPIHDETTVEASCAWVDGVLDEQTEQMTAIPIDEVGPELLAQYDDVAIQIENAIYPIALMSNLHTSSSVRNAAQQCLVALTPRFTEIFQNEDLYERFMAVVPENAVQAKLKKDLIEGFEDSGVALPEEKRERALEINTRLAELGQEFAKNIRENTTKLEFTREEAKGLPDSYIERVSDEDGNIVVGFDYPDYGPFMRSAESSEARKRYYLAFNTRGTEANPEILDEMMKLRKELAALYGYPSFAAFSTNRKMAGSPGAVTKFLDEVAAAVTELETRDLEIVRRYKAEQLGTPLDETKLERWDLSYWRERLVAERYSFDQESTRKYFPSREATAWLIDTTERLYGLDFERIEVPVWHPEVEYYDVKDAETGELVGGIYLDLYPRDGKYKHAAAMPVRGVSTRVGRKPISVLMTNFDRTGMTYGEIETYFHEFGHVMHGVLSNTYYNSHAGTNVARDFVEAPSQIYEEWAADPEVLAILAEHCPECPVIDEQTMERLEASERFGKGIDYARQHLYATFDMELTDSDPGESLAVWKRLEGATPLGYVEGSAFPGTFGHLAGGYAAGYYGYMWSEVIGLDMASTWGETMLDPAVGKRFRETILARGGEADAKEIVEEFLGREIDSKAFFTRIRGED